jgi:hypothetical protein
LTRAVRARPASSASMNVLLSKILGDHDTMSPVAEFLGE